MNRISLKHSRSCLFGVVILHSNCIFLQSVLTDSHCAQVNWIYVHHLLSLTLPKWQMGQGNFLSSFKTLQRGWESDGGTDTQARGVRHTSHLGEQYLFFPHTVLQYVVWCNATLGLEWFKGNAGKVRLKNTFSLR